MSKRVGVIRVSPIVSHARMEIFTFIIGFGLGFLVGIFLKWILRFMNFIKKEGGGLNQ